MSSGHAKDQVLPAVSKALYERALKDPVFQRALKKRYTVSRRFSIPYLGGYSKDGATLYIDKDFDLDNLLPALLVHEHWEKTAIDVWHLSYWYAHGLATYAEHQYAIYRLKKTPAKYESLLKPAIDKDEDEDMKNLPPDLDCTPYRAPDEPPKNGHFPSTVLRAKHPFDR